MNTNLLQLAHGWSSLAAANDDGSASLAAPAERGFRAASAGWDPYEVWRTRIKPLKSHTADTSGRVVLA